MWAQADRPQLGLLVLAFVVALSACTSPTATDSEPTTPESAPVVPTTPSTTTPPPSTTVATTIPTTSVPPSTLAPPELAATTTLPPATTTTIPDIEDAIVVTPEDDLASLVDRSPAGTRFIILPGEHRTEQAEPKDNMTFEGRDGAILNGSVLLEGFAQTSDGWDISGVSLNMERHGECVDDYSACALRNDLYIDDEMMWRVDERDQLAPGTWWSDGQRIFIADDPTGRKVEVSLTEHAFRSDADNVTIRNLVVEKYASQAQRGAIQAWRPGSGSRGENWLVENVEARLNHAAGIAAGDSTTIRNVHAHHNGQQGITGTEGTNILIESSEINHNNLRGFNWGWEAGGVKFTRTTGLVFRNLSVHHNIGPGLWADIDCYDTIYENNTVYSNAAPGIFHEISFDAVIRGNEVYGNGFIKPEWLWGSGILIAASSNVEVYDNIVTNNADGISGIQQPRENENGPALLRDVHVHDNIITMWFGQSGVVQDMGDNSVFTSRNIVYENNTYVGADHEAFAWNNSDLFWDEWLDTGQGSGSTLSDG